MRRESASVGECATELGFTQPAATQTLQLMARSGWVEVVPGEDRREHRYALTTAARDRMPALQSIWDAIARAADALDSTLPAPLATTIDAALASLGRESFHALIAKELNP
jgi:DNA-binding MarR family transcriptional regulator